MIGKDDRPGALSSADAGQVEALSHLIGHRFRRPELALAAMTHSSFAHEQRRKGRSVGPDNERLEFLGDAVLGLVMAEILMADHPEAPEGRLSRARSVLVSEKSLARVARRLGLGDHLRLGRGETQGGGRTKASILADALEALIAAVYLDAGLAVARSFVETVFRDELQEFSGGLPGADAKSRVQEIFQGAHLRPPTYRLAARQGPDHAARFEVALMVGERTLALGSGGSKKQAEKDAAARLLALLDSGDVAMEDLVGAESSGEGTDSSGTPEAD